MARNDSVTCDRCETKQVGERDGAPDDWRVYVFVGLKIRLLCTACQSAVLSFIDHKDGV